MLNIIHLHLNDSSDDVTVDVVYMKTKKTKGEEQNFVSLGGG
jgi:hypothetical protein